MSVQRAQLRLTLLDQVSGRMRAISAQMSAFQGRMRAMSAPFTGMTARVAAFGAGYLGVTSGMRNTVGAAIKFEDAFADVRKVLDGTPAELQEVRHQIIELSKQLPNSAEGIAAIYAQAAQSNIPMRELGKFSEMVAKVSVAWDTSESETSDAMAKIKNQLGLNVDQIGLFADAINHLGNNTAAKAPDLVDFAKRVAATGEMFGFTSTQTLAFGGAMVASGAQTEVASTSFRNMGRALTIGTRATKQHQIAFKRLGLDAVKTAKNMQKNALDTTLDVLDRIGKLPEWERISIASALFGDEARALMPVLANTTELRRQLGLVGNEANYAGSAFEEYLVRAQTTSNALAIIGNKLKAVFREWGEGMLPSIKALGAGLGDVLDTLDKRVGVLDQFKAAFDGLMTGLGYRGPDGLRQMVNDIGDLLFGKAVDSGGFMQAADERMTGLARISNQFRQLGRNIRQFAQDVADNPIAKFLAEIAGHGFKLMLASVGFSLLAGAVMKLGRALMFLSGASAAIAILKTVAGIGGAVFRTAARLPNASPSARNAPGAAPPGSRSPQPGAPKAWPKGKTPPWGFTPRDPALPAARSTGPLIKAPAGRWPGIFENLKHIGAGWLKGLGATAFSVGGEMLINDAFRAAGKNPDTLSTWGNAKALWDSLAGGEDVGDRYRPKSEDNASSLLGLIRSIPKEFWLGKAAEPGFNLREALRIDAGISGLKRPDRRPAIFDGFLEGMRSLEQSSIRQLPELQSIREAIQAPPSGTQDVKVTNQQPVHAPVNVTVYATTNASADEIGRATGERVKAAVEGSYSD